MKHFISKTQKTGEIGENICTQWLKNNGFSILQRNYTVPSGEIDIIAVKNNTMHFVEVKSVSRENTRDFSRETSYNPADNMTKGKLEKCQRAMLLYINDNNVSCETQIDLYLVYIDQSNISHKIERIENIF